MCVLVLSEYMQVIYIKTPVRKWWYIMYSSPLVEQRCTTSHQRRPGQTSWPVQCSTSSWEGHSTTLQLETTQTWGRETLQGHPAWKHMAKCTGDKVLRHIVIVPCAFILPYTQLLLALKCKTLGGIHMQAFMYGGEGSHVGMAANVCLGGLAGHSHRWKAYTMHCLSH